MQRFKDNDLTEKKFIDAISPPLDFLSGQEDLFYTGAYESFNLGGVIYDLNISPLVNSMTRENFIRSFFAIYNLFTRPGTFEFYIDVIRKVWGDSVVITFEIPNPGHLVINIEALDTDFQFFMARTIVDNEYQYDEVVDDEGDNIVFQVHTGLRTQEETDALFKELYPAGLFLETPLVLG